MNQADEKAVEKRPMDQQGGDTKRKVPWYRLPMHWIRLLYDWVLGWADSPYGVYALVILAFAESSFFPVPPDVLLIALVIGAREKAFKLALWCSIASVAGGTVGYAIGALLWQPSVAHFFYEYVPGFTPQVFHRVQDLYREYNFWAVFAAGLTPIPYKVFTITGGVFGIDFPVFVLASAVGRSARFFAVAVLIYLFGPPMKRFIEKYFDLLAIVFLVLLVGGFVLVERCSSG